MSSKVTSNRALWISSIGNTDLLKVLLFWIKVKTCCFEISLGKKIKENIQDQKNQLIPEVPEVSWSTEITCYKQGSNTCCCFLAWHLLCGYTAQLLQALSPGTGGLSPRCSCWICVPVGSCPHGLVQRVLDPQACQLKEDNMVWKSQPVVRGALASPLSGPLRHLDTISHLSPSLFSKDETCTKVLFQLTTFQIILLVIGIAVQPFFPLLRWRMKVFPLQEYQIFQY